MTSQLRPRSGVSKVLPARIKMNRIYKLDWDSPMHLNLSLLFCIISHLNRILLICKTSLRTKKRISWIEIIWITSFNRGMIILLITRIMIWSMTTYKISSLRTIIWKIRNLVYKRCKMIFKIYRQILKIVLEIIMMILWVTW